MDRKTALEKIKKCLALSRSTSHNEAATALRQARALMDKFNITDVEMLTSEVNTAEAKAGARTKPSLWENYLVGAIGQAFDCRQVFTQTWTEGKWRFIGVGAAPEIAQYAFSVLLRQIKKERAAFIKHECKHLVPASKTRRADQFCLAWVQSVEHQVSRFASTNTNKTAIEAYMKANYSGLDELSTTDRNAKRQPRLGDLHAISAGLAAGNTVQLNHGVGTTSGTQLALGA